MKFFQDSIVDRIDFDHTAEMNLDGVRRERFSSDHPVLSRVPVMKNFFSFFYIHGLRNVLLLGALIIFYSLIKAPYLDIPFTGQHATKYNTYVEPALYMAETSNPLWNQHKYTSDPVTNPEGIYPKFNQLPLFEWGLYLTYKIISFGNIEFKTRIFTHTIGIAILLFSYLFFSQWIKRDLALLTTALISINPLFIFSTFVTVLDSVAILFMFISLFLLSRYQETRKADLLFWAGLLYGIGVSTRYSLVLWMVPISLLIIYYRRESMTEFVFALTIYSLLGFLTLIAVRTSVLILPGATYQGFALSILWVLLLITVWYFVTKHFISIRLIVEKMYSNKIALRVLGLIILPSALLFFRFSNLSDYSGDFLTDRTLIFNPRLYKYMLLNQFKNNMTTNVFLLAGTGFLLALTMRFNNTMKLAISFFAGSLIYWILASKAIFIHNYYTIIMMITSAFFAAVIMYYLLSSANSKPAKLIIGALLISITVPHSYSKSIDHISKYVDVSEEVEFIKKNTDETDFIMYEGALSPMVIYTGRRFVRPFRLESEQIKFAIKQIGFAKTMERYHVKYLVSPFQNPQYIDFAPLFSVSKIRAASFNRNHFILNQLGQNNDYLEEAYADLDETVKKYQIHNKFKLEKDFGNIRFYSFRE